ncbi:MAG: VanZ family protein [Bacteroidales bacterium]|nr:VanZ family protein [Bacteroidales bacterium]MDD4383908.1 VanZ family protein [Bacteroidales bacterium]
MSLLNYWRSILWALLSLVACVLPGNRIPKINKIAIPHFDKVVHFTLFFVLTLLLFYENRLRTGNVKLSREPIFWIIVAIILYASVLEGLQYFFIASRSGNLADLAANFLGVFVAVLVYAFVAKFLINPKST